MTKLSCVIPYCNEWPMNVFTIKNISEELRDRADFELIAVNNYCDEVAGQPGNIRSDDDKAGEQLKGVMRGHKWLKALDYNKKLSHWQAKNAAVANSTGKWLFFCDAHCVISRDALFKMFDFVSKEVDPMEGTFHLPLTYHIMEYHSLCYKLVANLNIGELGYSFTPYRPETNGTSPFYEVPCMSTCGMMISRELYNYVGGWPVELGIYGGGEPFINFVLSTMNKRKYIFKGHPLTHHGSKRGYSWNFNDHFRNKCIAAYMYGGKDFARLMTSNHKGDQGVLMGIYNDVISKCVKHRAFIKPKQNVSLRKWVSFWQS